MPLKNPIVRIYIPLLDEGTPIVRPTDGELLAENIIRVLPTKDYDPEDESWEFPPGSIVRCAKEVWSDGEILVAREIVKLDAST